jgi:hypothetical protein
MTLSPSDRYMKYVPVVSTSTFLIPFPIFSADDLRVRVDGEDTELFSVTATFINGRSTNASFTLVTPAFMVDVEVIGTRVPARTNNYLATSPDLARNLQNDADILTAVQQEQARDYRRAIKGPLGFTGTLELDPEVGSVLQWFDYGIGNGPTADDIINAQDYADDAANSAALALAAAANSADGFPTIDAFERRLEVGDIYPIGAVVPVAGSFYQKVNLPNAAKGWGDTGERANWMETVLPKSEGAVKRRFMEKMSRKTFLGNPNEFDATPIQMGRTLALTTLGFDGGGDGTTGYYHLPELPNDPPAPSLLQKSIVTSSAGGAQAVTFETPFQTTVPTVILTAVASGSEIAVAQLTAAPTTTGFSFEVRNASGTRIARDVHYFAFGNGA